jgi:hypothetical protein
MRLFPYVLVRVGGGPFNKFEGLNLIESYRIVETIAARKEELALLKRQISDALYSAVAEQREMKHKQFLINLKRDIFNERKISGDNLGRLFQLIPHALQEQINDCLHVQNEIGTLWSKGEVIFEQEVHEVRQKFKHLAKDETLQKGLLLSSQSLLKMLDRCPDRDSPLGRKQEYQTEQSLVKYLSRMYAKTSPFSTFANLVMGKLSQKPANDGKPYIFSFHANGEHRIVSHIRLNNYLYAYLKGLLLKNPAIYRHFLVRLNPTLKKHDDHYVFLTNCNNIEAFQRIPANPVLEVFRHLASEKKEGMVIQEMVQRILEDEYIEASAESLEAYIYQLTEYGFLEFNIGVSGLDPDWDIKLRENLVPLAVHLSLITELSEVLARVRKLADQYGKASVQDRRQIIETAHHAFRAICMKLHEAVGLPAEERRTLEELQAEARKKSKEQRTKTAEKKPNDEVNDKAEPNANAEKEHQEQDEVFKHETGTFFYFTPEQMFYEDTTLEATLKLDEAQILKVVSALNNLLQDMKMFEGHLEESDRMAHFFSQKYGPSACIDLLTFYEEYYREVKKPEAEREKMKREAARKENVDSKVELENKNTPADTDRNRNESDDNLDSPSIPSVKKRRERNKAWLEHFVGLLKNHSAVNGDEITLTRALMQQAHQAAYGANDYKATNCSYGAFIQFFIHQQNGKEKLMAVINSSPPGYGKMLSRFLHVFDQSVTEEVRAWNHSLYQDEVFVENCDASYFNGNLHPPLMPFEVWMPSGHNNLPVEQQIPVTELHVEFDTTCNILQLIHTPTRKRMHIFDLGFQGHLGRSKLFQLLKQFTAAEYLSAQPVINAANKMSKNLTSATSDKKNETKIWTQPRIIYEDNLILQRKAWLMSKELLPVRDSQETHWHYFARVNLWRIKLGMPDEAFVFVNSRLQPQMLDDDARRKMGRDDYKPQYISFKNPFLVKLFEKLIQKVPTTMRIEEMLPNSQQLLKIGESRYVTEFVVQWYRWANDNAYNGIRSCAKLKKNGCQLISITPNHGKIC